MDDHTKILSLFSVEVSTEQVRFDKDELEYIKNDIYAFDTESFRSDTDYKESVITSYHSNIKLQDQPEFAMLAKSLNNKATSYAEKFLNLIQKIFHKFR